MLVPDVNVLVGAQRNDDSPHARTMRRWLEAATVVTADRGFRRFGVKVLDPTAT